MILILLVGVALSLLLSVYSTLEQKKWFLRLGQAQHDTILTYPYMPTEAGVLSLPEGIAYLIKTLEAETPALPETRKEHVIALQRFYWAFHNADMQRYSNPHRFLKMPWDEYLNEFRASLEFIFVTPAKPEPPSEDYPFDSEKIYLARVEIDAKYPVMSESNSKSGRSYHNTFYNNFLEKHLLTEKHIYESWREGYDERPNWRKKLCPERLTEAYILDSLRNRYAEGSVWRTFNSSSKEDVTPNRGTISTAMWLLYSRYYAQSKGVTHVHETSYFDEHAPLKLKERLLRNIEILSNALNLPKEERIEAPE